MPKTQPPALQPGTCRMCGCTDTNACVLNEAALAGAFAIERWTKPLTCAWTDETRTLCTGCQDGTTHRGPIQVPA